VGTTASRASKARCKRSNTLEQYARLRIGVGPLPEGIGDWADYVLNPFEPEELEQVQSQMPQMIESVEKWLKS